MTVCVHAACMNPIDHTFTAIITRCSQINHHISHTGASIYVRKWASLIRESCRLSRRESITFARAGRRRWQMWTRNISWLEDACLNLSVDRHKRYVCTSMSTRTRVFLFLHQFISFPYILFGMRFHFCTPVCLYELTLLILLWIHQTVLLTSCR